MPKARPTLIVKVDDGTGLVTLRFFHFRRAGRFSLKSAIPLHFGSRVRGGAPEFAHPEYAIGEREPQLEEALTPVYPVTEGMGQSTMRNLTQQALTYLIQNHPKTSLQTFLVTIDCRVDQFLHRPPPKANISAIIAGKHPAM